MPNPDHNALSLSADQLQLAISAYFESAYPGGGVPRKCIPAFPRGAHLDEMLASFERTPNGIGVDHFWLRLGNAFYPHMKLVVELTEYGALLSVDTHDQLALPPNAEGRDEWLEIQRRNNALRRKIEQSWQVLGLPTRRACAKLARASERKQAAVEPIAQAPVLIIDDELDAAQLMAVTLRCAGIPTVISTSAKDALKQARKLKPSMVICDFMMPETSGRELLVLFKYDVNLRDVPFVVASYAPLIAEEFPQADDLIAKPLYGKRLISIVKRFVLGEVRALSA